MLPKQDYINFDEVLLIEVIQLLNKMPNQEDDRGKSPRSRQPEVPTRSEEVMKLEQREFHELCKQLDRYEYPKLFGEIVATLAPKRKGDNPIHFGLENAAMISCPVITPDIVASLMGGASMLSVGAGPAYAERLLVKYFQIGQAQIELTDIFDVDIPEGFVFHQFDMFQEWPNLGKKFDHLIFLESATYLNKPVDFQKRPFPLYLEDREHGLSKLVDQAMNNWTKQGDIRIRLVLLDERIEGILRNFETAHPDFDFKCMKSKGTDSVLIVQPKETVQT